MCKCVSIHFVFDKSVYLQLVQAYIYYYEFVTIDLPYVHILLFCHLMAYHMYIYYRVCFQIQLCPCNLITEADGVEFVRLETIHWVNVGPSSTTSAQH